MCQSSNTLVEKKSILQESEVYGKLELTSNMIL